MNLKKFLAYAIAVSMLAGVPGLSYAEDNSTNVIANDSDDVIENDSNDVVIDSIDRRSENSTINRTERPALRRINQ